MIIKLAVPALLAFASPLVSGQTGDELPCGLTSSISCTDPTDGTESCKFDQRAWGNPDGCFEAVKITAELCNTFLEDTSGPVKVINANAAIELSGNAFGDDVSGFHGFSDGTDIELYKDECVTKVIETDINVCKKKYNVEINADAETPTNNNCRKFQFKPYSNKRLCKVTTSTTCTVNETGEPCADTTYTVDTCGVKQLDFTFEFCNENTNAPPVTIRPVQATTKATLGRENFDDDYWVPIDEGDLGPGSCSTISRSRDVNTCVSFAPNANTLLNAKILKNGAPDTINNQHCYSNTYLPGHNWDYLGLPTAEPTKEPSFAPTPIPGLGSDCDTPTSGKGGKGCSKGSKGSKGASGPARRQRKRVRERRNL